jgi:RNA polymerase sigma-70 factor, ECF subfamily
MKFGAGNREREFSIDLSEYLDGLYRYAMVLARNRTQAEDLVQETCLRSLRAMKRLRPDSNIKSWLFTILRNIWLNQLRQERTAREIEAPDPDEYSANVEAESGKDPLTLYVSSVEREQVRWAIQQLPLEFREVILLREYEELSYEEIATLLGCPEGTVMSRLARARSKLRDLLLAVSRSQAKAKVDDSELPSWDSAKADESKWGTR